MSHPRRATLDHLVSRKKPASKTVQIVLDADLAADVRDAEARLRAAEQVARARPDDAEAQAEVWSATEALDGLRARAVAEEAVVTMRFRGIGGQAWDRLLRDHPAPAGAEQGATFDPETFPMALVAASLEDPKLSKAEVEQIWASDDWNQIELTALFTAALEVNQTRAVLDLGKGSAPTANTGPRSDGARSAASRTASS